MGKLVQFRLKAGLRTQSDCHWAHARGYNLPPHSWLKRRIDSPDTPFTSPGFLLKKSFTALPDGDKWCLSMCREQLRFAVEVAKLQFDEYEMDAGTQNQEPGTTESDFDVLAFLRSPGCMMVFAFCSCVGGCFYSLINSDAIREIAIFDCGSGREIVFLKSGDCDESQPIYYEVRMDGETIVPMTIVYFQACDPGELMLDIRTAADGNVVGIVQLDSSGVDFWVVHDFRDRASWPAGDTQPEFRGSSKLTREDLEDLL